MTFELWMRKVDEHLIDRCGMTSADLPDYYYMDLFEDGVDPEEAAEEAFENAFE